LHKNVGRIANPSLKYRAIPIEVEGRWISRFVMSGHEAENGIWPGNRRIGNPSYEEVYVTSGPRLYSNERFKPAAGDNTGNTIGDDNDWTK
jgi:hypothetical protein